jgi:hypothetical protein
MFFLNESSRNSEQDNALKMSFCMLHYFKYLKHKQLIFRAFLVNVWRRRQTILGILNNCDMCRLKGTFYSVRYYGTGIPLRDRLEVN